MQNTGCRTQGAAQRVQHGGCRTQAAEHRVQNGSGDLFHLNSMAVGGKVWRSACREKLKMHAAMSSTDLSQIFMSDDLILSNMDFEMTPCNGRLRR